MWETAVWQIQCDVSRSAIVGHATPGYSNSVKAFLQGCSVTRRIRFTITASSSFEVPAGPSRSGETEWESNNRSSTRVKFECLESRRWYTNFCRIPRWSRKGRGGGCTISFSISSMRGNSFLNLWPIKYLQLPHGKDTEVEKFDRVFKAPTSL